jgi:hypothetical protein
MTPEEKLLRESKVIAVVGISPKPDRPSSQVASYLREKGYKIIPVNPGFSEIRGEKCYPSLSAVPEPVDIVDVFRASDYVGPIVEEAIAKKVRAVWLQLGVVNEQAAARAASAGLQVVMDKCLMMEHRRVFGGERES